MEDQNPTLEPKGSDGGHVETRSGESPDLDSPSGSSLDARAREEVLELIDRLPREHLRLGVESIRESLSSAVEAATHDLRSWSAAAPIPVDDDRTVSDRPVPPGGEVHALEWRLALIAVYLRAISPVWGIKVLLAPNEGFFLGTEPGFSVQTFLRELIEILDRSIERATEGR